MPLQKTQIPVRFEGGIDTKTAEQLVVPGSFLRLDNCVRRKTGRIEKRYGFEDLSTDVISSASALGVGKKLDTFVNDVVVLTDSKIYSYLAASDQWNDRGKLTSVLVDADPLTRNSFKQGLPDIATLGGFTVSVYEDSRTANSIRYSVVDDATGASIVSDTLIATTAERPRVVAVNDNTFLIGWRDTSASSLKLSTISIAEPGTLTSHTAVEVGTFIAGPWDFVSYGANALAVFNIAGSSVRCAPISWAGEEGDGLNGMPVPLDLAYIGSNGIAATYDATNNQFFLAIASTTGIRAVNVPISLNTGYAAANVARTTIRNVTIATKEDNTAIIYTEFTTPASVAARKNQIISSIAVTYTPSTLTTTTGSLTEFKRSVGLGSKAWYYSGNYYVTAAFDSALQSTYYVLRDDGYIVAKALNNLAGGLSQDATDTLKGGISSVGIDTDGRYIIAGRVKNSLRADNDGNIISTSVGIQRLAFTFGGLAYDADTIGQNYVIPGGVTRAYDGVSATELNFHQYPEDLTITGGVGTLVAGTYYYTAIYEWQDAKGQIHRSAPAVNVSIAHSGDNDSSIVVIPTLRLTDKTDTRADCKVVLYGGAPGDDTVMYRISDTTNLLTADTVTITESSRAASIYTGEILYTTGGVVESTSPPACKVITTHKNRAWIGGLEDGLTLGFSREQVYGEGVCFSEFLSLRMDPRGGDVKALASLDEMLIIFKKDAIFVLSGDGPLDTGAQNDYGVPAPVTFDIGCETPNSIVNTYNGLMFKSDKGIYLLDRSLGLKYIGAPVEEYNSLSITSAVVIEDVNEVRFTTSDGRCLVYNYFFDQWSTFTNYEAVSACKGLSTYLHLKSDGTVRKENTGYNDAGSRYSMSIETSWFQFADLQGYQRIYYIMGLGDYISDHHTRIKMAYDFEDAYTETTYFNVDTDLDLEYYGDDATYGDSSVYGGSGASIYQWYLRPRRQKCQSVKLLIEDIDTISNAGSGSFNFVGLTFMAGLKPGGPRMRSGQEIG